MNKKKPNPCVLYCLMEESAVPYKEGKNPFRRTEEDEKFERELIRELEGACVETVPAKKC